MLSSVRSFSRQSGASPRPRGRGRRRLPASPVCTPQVGGDETEQLVADPSPDARRRSQGIAEARLELGDGRLDPSGVGYAPLLARRGDLDRSVEVEGLDLFGSPGQSLHSTEVNGITVVAVSDRSHRGNQAGPLGPGCEGLGSELGSVIRVMIVPAGGRRLSMAMPSALVTRAAAGEESIDQPTTHHEQTSSTTVQYTLPSRVQALDDHRSRPHRGA